MKRSTIRPLLIAAILLLAALCIWSIISWKRWFGNEQEATYSVPTTPDRVMLVLGQNGATERTLTWRCDTLLSTARVQLICADTPDTLTIPATGHMVASRAGKQTFYRATFTNLLVNKNYTYCIEHIGRSKKWGHFSTTMPSDTIQFLLWGDVQDHATGTSDDLFEQALQKWPQTQFWSFCGDMIERPTDAYWQVFFNALDTLAGTVPIMPCTGNHDYLKGVIKRIDTRWTSYFGTPNNGPAYFIGRSYYVNLPNLCFIVIDTDGIQLPWHYMATASWLKKVLRNNKQKWTIVQMHHPIYSARMRCDNVFIRWVFRSIVKKGKVDFVIAGHDHSYARRATQSTPLYMVSTSSDKAYLATCDIRNAKVCCGHRLYQHVQISGNQMNINSYLAENGELYDAVLIDKSKKTAMVYDLGADIPEKIDLPARYNSNDSYKVRTFIKRRAERIARFLHHYSNKSHNTSSERVP